jgi:predicted nucleic acid-binding protein
MSELTFVDTNILVYVRDADQLRKRETAARCLQRLWQDRAGRLSVQVLSEYYVTLTQKLKPGLKADDAWDDVQALMSWAPQPIDCEVLNRAREIERRYRTSWWDATIVAAAQSQSCAILLSEDFQHGMVFGQVTVRNPFAPSIEEESDACRVPVVARPRHRFRGRPARPA